VSELERAGSKDAADGPFGRLLRGLHGCTELVQKRGRKCEAQWGVLYAYQNGLVEDVYGFQVRDWSAR
jgi:hypothetical protein